MPLNFNETNAELIKHDLLTLQSFLEEQIINYKDFSKGITLPQTMPQYLRLFAESIGEHLH